jgi:hypothetical protein
VEGFKSKSRSPKNKNSLNISGDKSMIALSCSNGETTKCDGEELGGVGGEEEGEVESVTEVDFSIFGCMALTSSAELDSNCLLLPRLFAT